MFKKNLFILPLFVSIIIIFYKFPVIPRYLFFDEVEFAKLAIYLNSHSYTPYSELATGHSTLYFYIILLFLKIFGISTFSLRLPAAIFGVISGFIFYKILEIVFSEERNKKTFYFLFPLFLTLIFITFRWYLNFARFSFEATFLVFLELTSIYFFFRFKNKRNTLNLMVSALFAGLAFHSYYPGRIFFVIPFLFLFFYFRKYFLTYAALVILITSPLVIYLTFHNDIRLEDQLYIKDKKYAIQQKTFFFIENVTKTVSMFTSKGDMNGRHNYPGKPALNPIAGLFFLIGFVAALFHLKSFYNQFFLASFFVALLPSLLTYPYGNPNMLRTITIIPSIVYFIGNSIRLLLNVNIRGKKYLKAFIMILIVLSVLYELRAYFVFQPAVFEDDASKIKQGLENVVNF